MCNQQFFVRSSRTKCFKLQSKTKLINCTLSHIFFHSYSSQSCLLLIVRKNAIISFPLSHLIHQQCLYFRFIFLPYFFPQSECAPAIVHIKMLLPRPWRTTKKGIAYIYQPDFIFATCNKILRRTGIVQRLFANTHGWPWTDWMGINMCEPRNHSRKMKRKKLTEVPVFCNYSVLHVYASIIRLSPYTSPSFIFESILHNFLKSHWS